MTKVIEVLKRLDEEKVRLKLENALSRRTALNGLDLNNLEMEWNQSKTRSKEVQKDFAL